MTGGIALMAFIAALVIGEAAFVGDTWPRHFTLWLWRWFGRGVAGVAEMTATLLVMAVAAVLTVAGLFVADD